MPAFDFTAAARLVCEDMTRRVAQLSHVDMDRVAVGFCQARKASPHGLQASLTPLRFQSGAETKTVHGRLVKSQRLLDGTGRDYLYLLQFYLPRFLDHPLEEKLLTMVHELWHISPAMDGDLRRHPGRCYAHGRSQREYDEHAGVLARAWLAGDPPESLYEWLVGDFRSLVAEHGGVCGDRYRSPRLAPATWSARARRPACRVAKEKASALRQGARRVCFALRGRPVDAVSRGVFAPLRAA